MLLPERTDNCVVIALAGNPNVGKSTIFNRLTGLNQHTGNWPGKTVASACGKFRFNGKDFFIADIPGTYSLAANSAEEEIARDFICFDKPDLTVVVADATCLERNLNLLFQITELTSKVILCVNLIDEAERKNIHIDTELLSLHLGIPVIAVSARSGKGIERLKKEIAAAGDYIPRYIKYSVPVEDAVQIISNTLSKLPCDLNTRWFALRLLDGDDRFICSMLQNGYDILNTDAVTEAVKHAKEILTLGGIGQDRLRDSIVSDIMRECENIAAETVNFGEYNSRDRKIDRILTAKSTGIPIMILTLFCIFWLTITGANYPSQILSGILLSLTEPLRELLSYFLPGFICSVIADGAYKTLAWVISVMLPPMAIFFPLFTLLEDLGYLPRIAFNLDNFFRKACTHGKQALTMCLGNRTCSIEKEKNL